MFCVNVFPTLRSLKCLSRGSIVFKSEGDAQSSKRRSLSVLVSITVIMVKDPFLFVLL